MAQRDKMETECVCVCVSEREREEIESVCCWSDGVREVCVCVFERERENTRKVQKREEESFTVSEILLRKGRTQ